MNASKVTITAETRAKLDNQALSPARKRELRECMIKERIRNATNGACTKQELVAASGLNPDAKSVEYARGVAMINSMVRRGVISHDNSNKFRKYWTVKEDARVKPTPEQVAQALIVPKEVVVLLNEFKMDKIALVDMAKQFAWTKNSDSLREFISYVENAIQ